ncbi:MAG TPA: protein kinase [Polyangiaceae bacterium]|jgi:serine/threonine-protein kinase|nr:protein kinase [Polyangiaceae bacterium]
MANDVFGIVGTTLAAAFHVEAVVAEGGFAVVYRAYHSGFRAPVALKCLKIPQHLSRADQERFEEQFHAEAELLFKLSSSIPTVVRPLHVEAIVVADGSFMPFIALEWLEGETLDAIGMRKKSAGSPFTLAELVALLTPVARALERAHRFLTPEGTISIVHRDMKPENVFLARIGGEDVVKILDFGIGKAKSVASQVAGRASQNETGATAFTPAYGAPEQWSPRRYGQTGPWTDVWGLALTIVELMAGRPIIDGDQAAMMGTTLDPERRPTPRTERLDVGDAAEAVFVRALAVDPRDRYTTAGEFWDALVAAQDSDKNRQTRLSPMVTGNRAAGRSGAYSLRSPSGGAPAPSLDGARPNLIPDLDTRAGAAALDLGLGPKPAASRSGQYRASIPVSAADTSELDSSPENALQLELEDVPEKSVQHPPPASKGRSGQWPAATAEVVRASVPPNSRASLRPEAPKDAPARSLPPPMSAAPLTAPSLRPGPSLRPAPSLRPTPSSSRPELRISPIIPVSPTAMQLMVRRFGVPAAMVAVGILTTILDGAIASENGHVFAIGPLRLAWLAVILVIGGIVLAAYRLLFDGAD